MTTSVELARHQWEEGSRRLAAEAGDQGAYEALMAQVDAVMEALRRRVGERFTLAELAAVYETADGWALEAVVERTGAARPTRHVSVAQDVAFHLYARGATDYAP